MARIVPHRGCPPAHLWRARRRRVDARPRRMRRWRPSRGRDRSPSGPSRCGRGC